MRASWTRSLLLLCLVVGAADLAAAQGDAAPPPVDPARLNDEFVIAPGAEPLFAEMLGSGVTLPGGCRFGNGQIERTYVVATYACDGGALVLELLHPDAAPAGGIRTDKFALAVKSGTAPGGLLDALAERIRAREDSFNWTALQGAGRSRRLPLVAIGAVAVAMVAFFVLRRLAAQRRSA